MISIYTDGASRGNPGPGGFGIVMIAGTLRKEISEGFRLTTNNRMELMGVIQGLEALKCRSHVELFTDSEYVRQGLMQWMAKWKANGWKRKVDNRGKLGEVKNLELWQELDRLVAQHELIFHRVAGHSGHPENDRCDELAVAAYQRFLNRA